ncbi:MAG: lipopolysaccharide heptosyltransferase II [Deltaproteobacteria bacterium]|jgi:heptosyltransferase II|nr:lipopolysaccharide heptosyltransferase II [Deltaproteobacteria bacterium]
MPDKILIRTPNWLGDLMMSTAFIQALLERNKDAQVDLIVRKGFESIPLPQRGRTIAYDKKQVSLFQFAREIKADNYDQIFVLPPSFSSALMAFWSRTPKRTGYPGDGRSIWLNDLKKYQKPHRTQHLINEYLQLLEPLPEKTYHPYLPMDENWISSQIQQSGLTLPQDFIVFAPGAKYGPAKMWPVQHYKKLAEQLNEHGIPVLIIGTQEEVELGDSIVSESKQDTNLCGKTSLLEMIAVMARSKLLVSNDSGTMHVMSALAKPQIALFGSTSITWTGPENPLAEVMTINYKCSPCFKRTCKYQHYECLTGILPEYVFESILKIMNHAIK